MREKVCIVILMFLLVAGASGEDWGVKKGDQFTYDLRYARDDLEISDKQFSIRITADPSIDSPNYLEITENSLSNYLKPYIPYFIIPLNITIEGDEIDNIALTRKLLYDKFNASVSYNNKGVIDVFQILDGDIVIFEVAMGSSTTKLPFPFIGVFYSLPIILLIKFIKKRHELNQKSRL